MAVSEQNRRKAIGREAGTAGIRARRLPRGAARLALLDAAIKLIREKGYTATSVDDLCCAAGVTKGAFFHYFDSKEALGVAAARHWGETTSALFAAAPYHTPDNPLDRVLAYIDFRRQLIAGELAEFTCLAGTMVQENYDSSAPIREACRDAIFYHAATLEADIAAAARIRGLNLDPASLARHTQAVLQGGFILAKAAGEAGPALESIDHLKRYFELLFGPAGQH